MTKPRQRRIKAWAVVTSGCTLVAFNAKWRAELEIKRWPETKARLVRVTIEGEW